MTHPTALSAENPETEEPLRRVIGRVRGGEPGSTLICIGGIHGNEPAGVEALRRVFASLEAEVALNRGELIGLIGNLTALSRRQRFIDHDLNRLWLPRQIEQSLPKVGTPERTTEVVERHDLLAEMEQVFTHAEGDIYVVDLHTTSGEGAPFVVIGDTLSNRDFAQEFSMPVVLGLEEHLDGTISEYLTNRGFVSLTLETGQHDSLVAVEQAEASVWVAMSALAMVDRQDRRVEEARRHLERSARSLPRFLEVRHRHPVFPTDGFQMQPGFSNFDPVVPDQLLASNRDGEIRSRWRGRLLMPLYQALGNDGFFVINEFRPFWLQLSALARHLQMHKVVERLPGISRHPTRADTLVVDRKIARFYAMELLHLLGFRRKRAVGDILLVSRRNDRQARRPVDKSPRPS